jgi:hypothetical protein
MTYLQIFVVQFTLSLVLYSLIAKWYVAPRLATLPLHDALIPLLFLHAFRHMGLVFLVPTVVGSTLPELFAVPTAYGDLLTGLLALVAILALRGRWPGAIALAWLVNIVGILDFMWGNYQGLRFQVALGAAYYIPTVVNPAMWIAHFMMFWMLINHLVGRRSDGSGRKLEVREGAVART